MRREVDGLATEEHGAEHPGPVVVLVHGSLDRATSFARVVRRLGDVHTVTYDRRGYGRSVDALPLRTTVAGHVDDLQAVVAGRAAVVIGHSYGGMIALSAASRAGASEATGGPVVAVAAYEPPLPWLQAPDDPGDAEPGRPAPPAPPASRPATAPSSGSAETGADDPAAAAERFFRRVVGDAAWDRLPERTRTARRAEGPALVAELAALRAGPPPFDVGALDLPTVMGRGSRSLPRQRGPAAWVAGHVPGAELVEIPGAGHGAHLTHPDAFADFVRRAVTRGRGAS